MFEWIRENGQIDLGNTMVGIGSVAVALATVFIALSANRFTCKRVAIDFTGLWIEEMRKTFAAYVAAVESLPHSTTEAERMTIRRQILEHDAYIRLKFGISAPEVPELFSRLDQIHTAVLEVSAVSKEEISGLLSFVRGILENRWRDRAA